MLPTLQKFFAQFTTREMMWMVAPAFFIVLWGQGMRLYRNDTLTRDVQEMAGPTAISCGISQNYASKEMQICMEAAIQNGQPFYAREEKEYLNVLSCNSEASYKYSVAYALTPDKRLWQIKRRAAHGLTPVQVKKIYFPKPNWKTLPSGQRFFDWGEGVSDSS